jgi:hypothetical protein
LLFARAITGDPTRGVVIEDTSAGIDGDYLEWLAAISPEHERIRDLRREEAIALEVDHIKGSERLCRKHVRATES